MADVTPVLANDHVIGHIREYKLLPSSPAFYCYMLDGPTTATLYPVRSERYPSAEDAERACCDEFWLMIDQVQRIIAAIDSTPDGDPADLAEENRRLRYKLSCVKIAAEKTVEAAR